MAGVVYRETYRLGCGGKIESLEFESDSHGSGGEIVAESRVPMSFFT